MDIITDSGRRQGAANKTDQAIVADMIINQMRWAKRPLNEYHIVNMGRLNELNGPAAYLFPTFEAADNFMAEADARAMSLGIDRELSITYPTEQAA